MLIFLSVFLGEFLFANGMNEAKKDAEHGFRKFLVVMACSKLALDKSLSEVA